jgi:hypothetical protein
VQGYCVRCRAKQNMLNATRTLMKNGHRAMIGQCECCGTKMSVAGKWDADAVDVSASSTASPQGEKRPARTASPAREALAK